MYIVKCVYVCTLDLNKKERRRLALKNGQVG